MKKKRCPKILIILMYSNRTMNNIRKMNFKKSIKNARLCFRYWYDEEGIKKLLNNIDDKLDAIIVSGSDYRIIDRSSPKVPEIIFKYAKKADKVLLLTATPLINYPTDIINLISLSTGEKSISEEKFKIMIQNNKSV